MTGTTSDIQAELEQLRADSAFFNVFSGLRQLSQSGDGGKGAIATPLSADEIDREYRFNAFVGTLIDLLPDSMTQKWVLYKSSDLEPGTVSDIQKQLDKVADKFRDALQVARKYGGSVLLLGADDGTADYELPLDEHNIRTIRWLNVVSSEKIQPSKYNDDPFTENYGQPELYRITGNSTEIHSSRLLRFDGVRLSAEEMRSSGWGDSVLTRCNEQLNTFMNTHRGVFASLKDFNQRVVKLKALASNMAQPGGKEKVNTRLAQMAMTLSALGLMGLDSENEEYAIVSRNYIGVLELLKHSAQLFAGATDLPPSKLFSLFNSSGLASEDSTQERYWSSYVANRQNRDLLPQLERYVRLLHLSKEGPTQGRLVKFELTFPSLFQLTELEEEQLKDTQSQRAERYFKVQAVTSDEIAKSLAEGIPLEGAIDLEARRRDKAALVQMPEGMGIM